MAIERYVSEPPAFSAEWLRDPAEIAQRIGGTDFVPQALRDNPAAITAALLYGAEVGLEPMTSLATIAVINGRPTLSSEAQRALILAAGHEVWFDEATTTRCIACGRRRGSSGVSRFTWTIDDAKRAGLAGRTPWRTYPRQMLMARASAELARAVFPDVVRGMLASEELDDGDVPPEPTAEPEAKPTRRRKRPATAPTEQPDPPPAATVSTADAGAGATSAPAPDEREKIAAEFAAEAGDVGEPETASDDQRRLVFALMRDVGIGADDMREQRLAYTSRVIQRDISTSAELTPGEAHALIDDLQRIVALPEAERWRELLPERELRLIQEGDELGEWTEP